MLRSWFLTLPIIIFSLSAGASSPQRSFLEQFASSRISMPLESSPLIDNPGRYPKPLNFMFEYIFAWTPTGEAPEFSSACSREAWRERMMDPRLQGSLQLQGALVEKYFKDCQKELETGPQNTFMNTLRIMSLNYEPQTHPFLRRVIINLPGNIKLKGLLALKGDMKKRPLVVVRLGIFSNVQDFRPERGWLMMLFEQAPFNVLVVENLTSSDFINNNSQFSFGGYDEGIQNIHIAKLLTSPEEPISKIVDSVHLFGISLGGHGVLFSSLLNKYNSPAKTHLINSFTALCPVVNLQETMKALTQNGAASMMVDWWGQQRLSGLNEKVPSLQNYERFHYLDKVVNEIARTYRGGLSYVSSVKLPPGMKDGTDFWRLNDFWPYYENVSQPVIIYATQQDTVVPFALNSKKIQSKEMKIKSHNLHVIDFPQGFHCTLPIPYDWSALTTLFESYILSHSPTFALEKKFFNLDLSDEEWKGFFDQGTHVRFKVLAPDSKGRFVTVAFTVTNSKNTEKSMRLSLPLSGFDFQFRNAELSPSEQDMIVRWLNQNLKARMKVEGGKPVLEVSWQVAK